VTSRECQSKRGIYNYTGHEKEENPRNARKTMPILRPLNLRSASVPVPILLMTVLIVRLGLWETLSTIRRRRKRRMEGIARSTAR
jgi:hypothetical protein